MALINTPPMVIVGVVGYINIPRGLITLNAVWYDHYISEEAWRQFYRNWYRAKKKGLY